MGLEYIDLLFIKKNLNKQQIQILFGVTDKQVSEQNLEDFLNNLVSLLSCSSDFTQYNCKENVKLSKYDEDESWMAKILVSTHKVFKVTLHVLSLTWARYIYQHFEIPVFATDLAKNDGSFLFLYNERGLIISEHFEEIILQKHPLLGGYSLSEEGKKYFCGELEYSYENLSHFNISQKNRNINKDDIVVHCYQYSNPYYNVRPYRPQYYAAQAPLKDSKLMDFCCIGPIQFIVEKSDWQYVLIDWKMPMITKTYRAESDWRDVILLDAMEKQFFDKDSIVTTGDGEIIFMVKNQKFIINTSWQEYFSKFPIKENYIVDDDIKVLDTFQYNK